ncbi:TolC family protein [Terrihabitans rhizophilus]|uniref:TolC family protein n=1 Tax=Terrihabitans rhizophilus TaxID=3092662 RepID=A0ABU4RRY8_9HYPH|nr:TolC family protein [Terrihabitans sp. PJ23]MDX6806913.1 TolC family protein [Terrihabitans sp. PJ23]
MPRIVRVPAALAAALCLSACASSNPASEGMGLNAAQAEAPAPVVKTAALPEPVVVPVTATRAVSGPAARSSASALGLQAAVDRAVDWHPAVAEAVGRLNQSSAEIAIARAGYRPQISTGMNSRYNSYDRDGWRPRLNVTGSQMLYDFGKVSSEVGAREALENVSRAQLLVAVDTLIRDTAQAVIEVQRSRALRAVAEEQLEGIRAIADLVSQRSGQGASTRSDDIQARARVEAAQSTLLQIEAEVSRWEGILAAFMGATGGTFAVDENVPPWLMSSCTSAGNLDWSRVPAMMEADARREEAVALLKGSRANSLPTVSLEAGAGYDLNENSFSRQSRDQEDFNIGLNVSSKLYEGGAGGARREAASHALIAAEAARENARFQVNRSLAEARGQLSDLSRLQASLASRSAMMAQTRDLYRQQYFELGTRTLLDLLNSEQELHSAMFDTVNTAHDVRRLNTDCLFNSGQTRQAFRMGGKTVRGVALDS